MVAATEVSDRLDVMALSSRYAWGVDTLDRAYLAEVFTEDAVAEYVGVGKNALNLNERLVGFEAIFDWLHANLASRRGTDALPMHFVSNQLVDLDGDEARLTYYMRNRAASAGGVYYVKAVRTPKKGWQIEHLRLEEQTWKPEAYASDENARKYLPEAAGGDAGSPRAPERD